MNRIKAVKDSGQSTPSISSKQNSRQASRASSRAPSRQPSDSDDSEEWGGGSADEGSVLSLETPAEEQLSLKNWKDDFMSSLEKLDEKRASTREDALKLMCTILRKKYAEEILENSQETILDALVRCLKKDKSTLEGTLASQAIALCFITLGADQPRLYHEVAFLFKYYISHSTASELRAACASALAMACFVASSDESDTLDLLDFFTGVFTTNHPAPVLKAALNGFGLIYTSAASNTMAVQAFEKSISTHVRHLGHASAEVRMAAGENIALMYETLYETRASNPYGGKKQLISTLYELSKESSKQVAKKERSIQKATFREILKTVEDRQPPELKLKIQNITLNFDSWVRIRRLQAMREALGLGLLVHLEENELLKDIFGMNLQDASLALDMQQRYIIDKKSSASKGRTMHLEKQRNIRKQKIVGEEGDFMEEEEPF